MEIFEEAARLKKEGRSGVFITVVGKEGHGPAAPGARLLLTADGSMFGTVGGGALENAALTHARTVLENETPGCVTYLMSPENDVISGENTGMMCGGGITLFYEYIGCGPHLYIFGAGHVGRSVADFASRLGYYVVILDSREGAADAVQCARQRLTSPYPDALSGRTVPHGAFFVVATHSHPLDYTAVKRIVSSQWNPRYIGLIASRKKAPAIISRLREELGDHPDLSNLFSPIGLDTGGASPDEIALSICAEIQALRYQKTGNRHMRDTIPHE